MKPPNVKFITFIVHLNAFRKNLEGKRRQASGVRETG
jgi:hypothetical protein